MLSPLRKLLEYRICTNSFNHIFHYCSLFILSFISQELAMFCHCTSSATSNFVVSLWIMAFYTEIITWECYQCLHLIGKLIYWQLSYKDWLFYIWKRSLSENSPYINNLNQYELQWIYIYKFCRKIKRVFLIIRLINKWTVFPLYLQNQFLFPLYQT